MDALRKAEQQKQQTAAQDAPASAAATPDTLELAPLPEQAAAAPETATAAQAGGHNRLPELPTRMEDLDAQFFPEETPIPKIARTASASGTKPSPRPAAAPPRPQMHADAAARANAQNLFAAKPAAGTGGHGFALAVGGLTLVAVVAIGGYLYWQMQPKGGLAAGPALAPVAPAMPAAATAAPPAPSFAPPPPTPGQEAVAAERPQEAPPPRSATPAEAGSPPTPRAAARATPTDTPIRLSATPDRKTAPALEHAYQAFNRGETEHARTAWQQVLQSDRRNPDALHGLAAIAQQEGQTGQALDYYLRALEVDPKDALALAGLVSLKGQANPQQTESRLKTLLAEQPESPYLNFALGNLYAQGSSWAEAQQAFFQAHVADPANPDYLYNLAVSLDHLHQPRQAARYYAQALDAAGRQVAGFDPAQAAARLKVLQE